MEWALANWAPRPMHASSAALHEIGVDIIAYVPVCFVIQTGCTREKIKKERKKQQKDCVIGRVRNRVRRQQREQQKRTMRLRYKNNAVGGCDVALEYICLDALKDWHA